MADKKHIMIRERGAEIILTVQQLRAKPFQFPPAVPMRDSKDVDRIALALRAIYKNKN